MAEITAVVPGSPAERAGVQKGDWLLELNGHPIADVLDYQFYATEEKLTLKLHRGEKILEISLCKGEYEDLGLEFATYLMDEKRSCRNKCVFCFIDQLPKGMRDTLYFKDDDSRLSFLQGNYVTLTNMKDEDLQRIVQMHITPVNVSVHTTNGDLRVKMMKNRFAGEILRQMKLLAQGGVQMNCQIVLCKGLNDGAELQRTMKDLEALYPAVESVSVVPAGMTCHREGLYPLEPFSPEECREIISQVEQFAAECRKKHGVGLVYCADELYIKAGLTLPRGESYDGYPQIENGVGMMTSMEEELNGELAYIQEDYTVSIPRELSVATGVAAYEYICRLVAKVEKLCYNTHIHVYRIENEFFGKSITVAGLICGCDLIKPLGSKLVLPSVMLREDKDLFLDGTSLKELSEALQVPVELNDCTGADFLRALMD